MAEKKNNKSADLKKKSTESKVVNSDNKNSSTVKANANKNENLFVSPTVSGFFWTFSAALICAAIFGNYYYTNFVLVEESTLSRLIRVLVVIFVILLGLGASLFTNKGRALLQFARQSYTELKKVVWPTRQEAVQTTFIVFVAVSVVSLFLYLCDIVFLQIVRLFTL